MEEEAPTGSDNIVTEYNTYEDFLDSQITSLDLYYLEVCIVAVVLNLHAIQKGILAGISCHVSLPVSLVYTKHTSAHQRCILGRCQDTLTKFINSVGTV